MSNKREREKRREERLRQESRADAVDRRTRLLRMGAGAAFLVLAAVVVLIVVSSSSDGGGGDASLEGVAEIERELSGIPQNGMVLGDPGAAVEVIEYGDLQCPACKAYSEEVLPTVIEGQVKRGRAKIAFRNFTIIGPESVDAGTAALAAGAQGRGWSFVDLFYKNQGAENDGYVTDEFLTEVVEAAGVEDVARWNRERNSSKLESEVEDTTAEAQRLGLEGTPSFAIEGPRTDGMEILDVDSASDLEAAIESAS